MLNPAGLLGQIDRTPPTAPGTPLIHFRAEDLVAGEGSTWDNAGSGGATYDGTWADDSLLSGPVAAANLYGLPTVDTVGGGTYQAYLVLATEYLLPSQFLVGMVLAVDGSATPCPFWGQKASHGAGISVAYDDGDQDPLLSNTAGTYIAGSDNSTGYYGAWNRWLWHRTGASALEWFRNGVSKGTGVPSGSYYLGQVCGQFGGGWQGAGKLAEFIVYPSTAVTPAELDAYFCRKFGLTP